MKHNYINSHHKILNSAYSKCARKMVPAISCNIWHNHAMHQLVSGQSKNRKHNNRTTLNIVTIKYFFTAIIYNEKYQQWNIRGMCHISSGLTFTLPSQTHGYNLRHADNFNFLDFFRKQTLQYCSLFTTVYWHSMLSCLW